MTLVIFLVIKKIKLLNNRLMEKVSLLAGGCRLKNLQLLKNLVDA